jgi:hypothetical protein
MRVGAFIFACKGNSNETLLRQEEDMARKDKYRKIDINWQQIRIILEETLAAASIFAIAFAWLLIARGLGWH